MRMSFLVSATAALLAMGGVALAEETVDNGTDPTKMRRMFWTSYESLDLKGEGSRGSFEMLYEQPLAGRTALRLTVPVVGFDGVPGVDSTYALGDVSLRLTHIAAVTPKYGNVFQAEIYADSAERPELGYGNTALKLTFIHARFLSNGAIFAPSLGHTQNIGGSDQIRETVLDLYYVPKLPDPAWYMTLDPALVANWEGDKYYGSLAVTVGRAVGHVGDGVAQVYLKPSAYIGSDRPAEWGVEAGFRVIGF